MKAGLRTLDLNLLKTLDALQDERSASCPYAACGERDAQPPAGLLRRPVVRMRENHFHLIAFARWSMCWCLTKTKTFTA